MVCVTAAGVAILTASALAARQRPETFDIIIRGGTIIDGTGAAAVQGDIAVLDGRIVSIGAIPATANATRTIDATGATVAPGFIDVHSHAAEGLAGRMADAMPLLAQGVTTVFVNPDGGGPVDLAAQRHAIETKGVGVNVGQFVPQARKSSGWRIGRRPAPSSPAWSTWSTMA